MIHSSDKKLATPESAWGKTRKGRACNQLPERYTDTVTYQTVIKLQNKGSYLFRHIVVLQ